MFGGISKELAKEKDDKIEQLEDTLEEYKKYLEDEYNYDYIGNRDEYDRSRLWSSDGALLESSRLAYEQDYGHLGLKSVEIIEDSVFDIRGSKYNLLKIENDKLENDLLRAKLTQFYWHCFLHELETANFEKTENWKKKKTYYSNALWDRVAKKLGIDGLVNLYDVYDGMKSFRLDKRTAPEKVALIEDYKHFLNGHNDRDSKCKICSNKNIIAASDERKRLKKLFTVPD